MQSEQLGIEIVPSLKNAGDFQETLNYLNKIKAQNEQLRASNKQVADSAAAVGSSMRQQRQGVLQLGMQFQDFGTSIGGGTSVMQAFIQQSGQAGYAMSQMGGIAGRVGAFFMNPWVSAFTAAAMVVYALTKGTGEMSAEMKAAQKAAEDLAASTKALRDAKYAYQLVLARTLEAQKAVRQQMLADARIEMHAAQVSIQASISRVRAIEAEIAAIEARADADTQSAAAMGDAMALQAVTAGRTMDLSGAKKKLHDAKSAMTTDLTELQKTMANVIGRMGDVKSIDFNIEDRNIKAAESAAKSAAKAAKDAATEERQWMEGVSHATEAAMEKINIYKDMVTGFQKNMVTQNTLFFDNLHAGFKVADYEYQKFAEQVDVLGQSFDAIGNSVADGFKGMITGAQSFGDAMKNVIQSVIDQLFKLYVTQQIVGMVSGALSGIGIPLPGLTGKAIGGAVQGGNAYMVGERGPEMFVPSRGGSIVPNNKLGGGININVDARGSNDPAAVRAQVQQGILEAAPYIIAAAKNNTLNSAGRTRLPGSIL